MNSNDLHLMTVREAAEVLGLRESWLSDRAKRREIPHRRLGRLVRFTEADLRAIVDDAQAPARPARTSALSGPLPSRRLRQPQRSLRPDLGP